jgi:hypothetical protein
MQRRIIILGLSSLILVLVIGLIALTALAFRPGHTSATTGNGSSPSSVSSTRTSTGTAPPGSTPNPTSTGTAPAGSTPTQTPNRTGIPNFSHIFQIVLENTSYEHLIGSSQAPYINTLANQYGLATQFYAITHPSLPNYFALTGGSTFGVDSDCAMATPDCPQNATNLPDLIEQSGRTWVSYFESMPTPCDTYREPPYTIHFNPFVYYTDIVNNTQRCQSHVLPYDQAQFFQNLSANNVPNYVWIAPNLNNDIHDGTILQADTWLSTNVSQIIASQAFRSNGLIIITFDEGDDGDTVDTAGCCGNAQGGHIVTLLISPLVTKGYRSTTPETHYNLLRTIEDAWGLAPLGASANVTAMREFFG